MRRIAFTSLLIFGLTLLGANAASAVTGSSGSDSASIAQYGKVQGVTPESPALTPESPAGGETLEKKASGGTPEKEASGDTAGVARDTASAAELPFTGLPLLPLLFAGTTLIATGALLGMRRRGRSG